MIGVLINTLTVLIGSTVGLLLKKGLPKRISDAIMSAIGLCTLYIGIDGALEGGNVLILIVSMVIGTAIGTALKIDDGLNRLGSIVENRFKSKDASVSVAQGFVTGSLLFCVGAMTIVGSLNAGLTGDIKLLITKSLLDLISSCMLASSLGKGVLLSALFVLLFQGALVLLAGLLQGVLTDEALIAEITCTGSLIIIALGLNIIGITKLKVADYLPAILITPIAYYLIALLPL